MSRPGPLLGVLAVALLTAAPARAVLEIAGVVIGTDDATYRSTVKFLTVPADKQDDPAFSGEDVAAIKALEDPIRREIVDRMIASPDKFAYVDRFTAVAITTMRIRVIAIMDDMNNSVIDFDYFKPEDDPQVPIGTTADKWMLGAKNPLNMKLKAGENAHDGIKNLLAAETRADCAAAIDAAILGGAADALGKTIFNRVHPPGSLVLAAPDGYERHSVSPSKKVDPSDPKNHVPGDNLYLPNHKDYATLAAKKKITFWQGVNLIYMGSERYSGLGVDRQNIEQLRDSLKKAFEKDTKKPFPGDPATVIRFRSMQRRTVIFPKP